MSIQLLLSIPINEETAEDESCNAVDATTFSISFEKYEIEDKNIKI